MFGNEHKVFMKSNSSLDHYSSPLLFRFSCPVFFLLLGFLTRGAFYMPKFWFKRKWNGSAQAKTVKVVHLQRWSSLTSRSGPTKNLPFHFQTFSFPIPLELVTAVKMADGSDVIIF